MYQGKGGILKIPPFLLVFTLTVALFALLTGWLWFKANAFHSYSFIPNSAVEIY